MARRPRAQQSVELLRPATELSQNYVQPQRSSLNDAAEALSAIDAPLREFISGRAAKFKEEEELRGEAAFFANNAEGLAEGVRTGKVPAHYSGAFVRGFKQAQGNVAGNNLEAEFSAAFDTWEGKDSEDPAAFDQFFEEWVRDKVGTDDPEVLAGVLPHIRGIHDSGTARWIEYRHKQVYEGSLEANVAGANQEVDKANAAGLSDPAGTNYAAVFAAVNEKRSAFIASGGRPQDFDKAMIDAMSAKVLSTRDPGLLAWFDQKVPGEDYTYGDSPYGQGVKQNTIEALEVIARRSEADDYTMQQREDERRKDEAHRQTIELLAGDPNAELPDGLIAAGRKYDPTFDVRVMEWRRSLGTGFTDPTKLQSVYSAIMDGGGYRAVQNAASAGVFGRPEDLTAAYNFAKSFEDSKDRIGDTLGGSVAKTYLDAIDTRTKGKTDLGEPISGMSNEGFEATYDFRRMVQEWVVRNPDATAQETEDALSKIGKSILDRITVTDPMDPEPGTYERPGGSFDNPYTEGTAPVPGTEPEGGDEESPDKKAELEDFMNGLDETQRAALEEQAAARGVTPEQLAEQMLDGQNGEAAEGEAKADPIAYRPNEPSGQGFSPEQATSFLDDALRAAKDEAVEVLSAGGGNRSTGRLLDLIRRHEAAGNYNAVYGNAKSARDLSQLTVNQILSAQAVARRRGVASTAIGGYQIIYKTLRRTKAEMGLSGNEKFTPELQDRMAIHLLKRRGLDSFLAGTKSKRSFALGISQEWAAFPNPSTGRSFYAGDGLNASSVRTAKVYQVLGLVAAGGEGDIEPLPINPAYAGIPEKDSLGLTNQRARFMEWNPDPIGNHEANLKAIDPQLAAVVRKAQEYGGVDFVAASGKRDKKLQAKAVEWGWSKTVNESDHLHGGAVDLWPIIDGKVKFDKKAQLAIVKNMKRAAKELGVELDVGAEFKRFKDAPHFAIKGIRT